MSGDAERDGPDLLVARHEEIAARRQTLERRLEDGYRRIDQAIQQGTDVGTWEGFWIVLLQEYEAVCDELRPAA